jgi:hypothetical protein
MISTDTYRRQPGMTRIDIVPTFADQRFTFDNGYGASVIHDPRDSRYAETAVTNDRGEFVYDTPLTRNVIAPVKPLDIDGVLERIASLPQRTAGAPSGEASRPGVED